MNARATSTPAERGHPLRVVMRRTGLSADLLRAWERRYGVVTPARSASGRRLYSDADIERLRLLYRATLVGRSIGQVAGLSTRELAALVRRDAAAEGPREGTTAHVGGDQALHLTAPSADYLDAGLRAVERLDAAALEAALRRAAVALAADAFLDALIAPLLERVGTGWREGMLRPVHGHLASVVLRRALDRVIETAAPTAAAPRVVVATPVGQIHELGAMLAAAAAAAEGWRVTYLGAGLPAEDIAEAAVVTRGRAVALSIVYPAGDPAVVSEIRRLARRLPSGVTLIAGGAAAPAYRPVLDEVGAVLSASLADFRARLRAMRGRLPAPRVGGAGRARSRDTRPRIARERSSAS